MIRSNLYVSLEPERLRHQWRSALCSQAHSHTESVWNICLLLFCIPYYCPYHWEMSRIRSIRQYSNWKPSLFRFCKKIDPRNIVGPTTNWILVPVTWLSRFSDLGSPAAQCQIISDGIPWDPRALRSDFACEEINSYFTVFAVDLLRCGSPGNKDWSEFHLDNHTKLQRPCQFPVVVLCGLHSLLTRGWTDRWRANLVCYAAKKIDMLLRNLEPKTVSIHLNSVLLEVCGAGSHRCTYLEVIFSYVVVRIPIFDHFVVIRRDIRQTWWSG